MYKLNSVWHIFTNKYKSTWLDKHRFTALKPLFYFLHNPRPHGGKREKHLPQHSQVPQEEAAPRYSHLDPSLLSAHALHA